MFTYERLKKIVNESISFSEVQRKLGYNSKGGKVYIIIKDKIKEYNIDTSHFKGYAHGTSNTAKFSLEKILVKNSKYHNIHSLKRRLIKEKIMEYKCSECDISEWKGKKLSLELDHINGINNDHRIENIRLLCPNCHSQTETFGGKNKRYGSSVGRAQH